MYGNWAFQNRFNGRISNQSGQPATTQGTSITPGDNTFPAYVEILSATAYETCLAVIHLHDGFTAANARNMLVNIGIDTAGGTTYVTRIPNLLCTGAGGYLVTGGGCYYIFPLYIPAGATLAAQASVDNATVGTVRVGIQLYGRPSRPESVCVGHYVTSFGEDTAASTGTAVTPGTVSEGAYVQLGIATARDHWWWQLGTLGMDDTIISPEGYHLDLAYGDATNKHLIIDDLLVGNSNSESLHLPPWMVNAHCAVPIGQLVYGRAQASATQANHQMLAYGLGG